MNDQIDHYQLHTRRRGISVLEMSLALLIVTFAIGGLLQILTLAAGHRRTTEVRRLAVQVLANQAEQISLLAWDQLTPEKLAERKASDALLEAAPSARLKVTVAEETGPPVAKHVHLEVSWNSPDGDAVEPVRLTIWRHQPAEARP